MQPVHRICITHISKEHVFCERIHTPIQIALLCTLVPECGGDFGAKYIIIPFTLPGQQEALHDQLCGGIFREN